MYPKPEPARGRSKRDWTLADLIDFEYLLEQDETRLYDNQQAREEIQKRDRDIFLSSGESITQEAGLTQIQARRALLHVWLEHRRSRVHTDKTLSPGSLFQQSFHWLSWLVILIGGLSGLTITSTLLHFDGHRPVNIAWFGLILIGLQLVILLFSIFGLVWRQWRMRSGENRHPSLFGCVCEWVLIKIASVVLRRRAHLSPSELMPKLAAAGSMLRQQKSVYGSLLWLPIAQLSQLFGVAFNIVALGTTAVLILFSDIAFGWSSTTTISAASVHELVRMLAFPWHFWLGEGYGYPTLDQVAGSRIYLEQWAGLHSGGAFDPLVLRSWSYFLLCALFCYGLLPRLVLMLVCQWAQRYKLRHLDFSQARSQALLSRMKSPLVSIPASQNKDAGVEMPIPSSLENAQPSFNENTKCFTQANTKPVLGYDEEKPESISQAQAVTNSKQGKVPADQCVLLLHVDVEAGLNDKTQQQLNQTVHALTSWQPYARYVFGHALKEDASLLTELTQIVWQQPPGRIVLINDGTEPPITEYLLFLRQLRAAVGPQTQLVLALVGDMEGDSPLAPLSQFDFQDWRQKINQLADPWLRLDPLVGLTN